MTAGTIAADEAAEAVHRHERRHAAWTLTIAVLLVGASLALHRAGALRLETALPAPGDEKALRRLGVNLTSEPRFASNKLFAS